MTDIFVVTPFDTYTTKEFCEKKEQLAKEGRKVMAVVFNCRSLTDFEIKYFGEQICFDREVIKHWDKKIATQEDYRVRKERAAQGHDFSDVGHVDMDLVEVTEVDGEKECFPEIRSVWC